MSSRTPFLPIAIALAMAGCAGSPVLVMEITHEPPRAMSPRLAELFVAGPPQRPYLEVGVITVAGGSWSSAHQLLKAMVQDAGSKGCDGVVITSEGWSQRGGCLVWPDPAPAPEPRSAAPPAPARP